MDIRDRVHRGPEGGTVIKIPKFGAAFWERRDRRLFGRISSLFIYELPERIEIKGVPHKKENNVRDYEDYDIVTSYQGKNVYVVTKKTMSEHSYGIRRTVMKEEESRRVPGLADERMERLGFGIEQTIQMHMIIDPYIVRILNEKKFDEEYATVLNMLQKASNLERIERRIQENGEQRAKNIWGNANHKVSKKTKPSDPAEFGYVGSLVRKKGKLKIKYNSEDKRVKKVNSEIRIGLDSR